MIKSHNPKTTPIGIRFAPSDLYRIATLQRLDPALRGKGYGKTVRYALAVAVESMTKQEGGEHE